MDGNALTQPHLPEGDVVIPGVGTVRVRGLSRAEAMARPARGDDVGDLEAFMLATCMIDPALTVDEARAWQAGSPMEEISPVVAKINELSGLTPEAPKDAMKTFRGQS